MNDLFDHRPDLGELPRRLGNYELTQLLGCGGMGEVYLAYNVELKEPAAIKLLPKNLARDTSFVNRFRDEARKLRKLQHPHIVQAHDFGRDKDDFYLVMEYIDGGDLQGVIDENPDGLDPELARDYLLQIVSAVKEAHRTTIHRDLSPNNILITSEGNVKVSDFGLSEVVGEEFARSLIQKSVTLSQVGFADTLPAENSRRAANIVGKVRYMSPQVTRGEFSDRRNDIYALGIMLYDMLTGRTTGMVRSLRKEKPELDPGWQRIFDKCTADNIEERYQRIEELEADLWALSSKPRNRRKWPVLLGLSLLALAGAAGYYYREDVAQFAHEALDSESGVDPQTLPTARAPGASGRLGGAASSEGAGNSVRLSVADLPSGSVIRVVSPQSERQPAEYQSAEAIALPPIESDYTLRFEHPDYRPVTFTVPGDAGVHPARFELEQLRLRRTFSIATDPPGAEVIRGGAAVGTTPLRLETVFERASASEPYSNALLELRATGYHEVPLRLSSELPSNLPVVSMQSRRGPRKLQIALPGDVMLEATYVEAGQAVIGSPETEMGRIAHSEQLATVEIKDPFYIGNFEVTQEQYEALTGSNPSFYFGDKRPVEQVTFSDLTAPDGFLQQLTNYLNQNGYDGWQADLPSNAEWEYAARAGTLSTFYNGANISRRGRDPALDEIAVYLTVSTQPVGTKQANPWGLYDTLGNVSEWTREGELRGGSFKQQASTVRPAYRLIGKADRSRTDKDANQFGFRVALRPPAR